MSAPDWGRSLGLAAVYFLTAKVGLALAVQHPSATPVWAPTGISMAVLLLFGRRLWPGVFAGAFLANVTTAGSVWTSLLIAAGNALEAIVGAALAEKKAGGVSAFDRPATYFRFAVYSAAVATTVSATIGVASLAAFGYVEPREFLSVWRTWWLGDAVGAILFAPVLVLCAREGVPRFSASRWGELALFCAALTAAGLACFGPWGGSYPMTWLPAVVMLWPAVRFGPRETASAMLALALISLWGTLQGHGPWNFDRTLVHAQAFIGGVALVMLGLATALAEGRRVEEVERQKETAEAAYRELEAFSYYVSHDLRTPLRHICSFSEMLQERYGPKLDDEGRTLLTRLVASSVRMAALSDDVLELLRVGKRPMTRANVDLSALAADVVETLRLGDPARRLEVVIQPGLQAQGDESLLRIALQNLLENAWKFTSDKPRARIEFGRRFSGEFFVGDDGPGFDPAYAQKVFLPFQRLDTAKPGTGIGLALVQRIVERHGGKVWAESIPGDGAAFCFTLA